MNPPLSLVQTDADPFQTINDFLGSPLLTLGLRLVALFFAILWLALVYWTFTDADRRGAMRWYWGIVALVFPFIGTLIYVIVRPPEYVAESRERELELAILERELRSRSDLCPNCRSAVKSDFLLCPECNWDLKRPCESCARPLQLEWATCPYCATAQRKKNIEW